jgi:hypothetical protein
MKTASAPGGGVAEAVLLQGAAVGAAPTYNVTCVMFVPPRRAISGLGRLPDRQRKQEGFE